MIGETLEQHCQMVFDLRQADGCFPNAQLLKDNDVVNGTKGDFIFKDYDEDGNEIISVMLEMKNQSEIGNIKKKNSDHYSKLDKDRAWLLENLDKGKWPEIRNELAQLERKLSKLIISVQEDCINF